MDKIDSIRSELNNLKGTWPEVCKATGLDYSWLTKFAQGRIPNPGYQFVASLEKFLADRQSA